MIRPLNMNVLFSEATPASGKSTELRMYVPQASQAAFEAAGNVDRMLRIRRRLSVTKEETLAGLLESNSISYHWSARTKELGADLQVSAELADWHRKNIFVARKAGSVADRGGADLSAQNRQIGPEVPVEEVTISPVTRRGLRYLHSETLTRLLGCF